MSLPPARILGLGAVTPLGRDLAQISTALSHPPAAAGNPSRVDDALLQDPQIARKMRRAGRFSRMAVLAAGDAWNNAGLAQDPLAPSSCGVILTTGFGPHARTFQFLDGILDHGENAALPTDFSHSVHNVAVAYLTETLGIRGRCCTLTDFAFPFEQALLLAQLWLAEGACSRVLVGAVDELGQVLLDLAAKMLPGSSERPACIPGEGAVFFLLGSPAPAAPTPASSYFIDANAHVATADLLIVDDPCLQGYAPAADVALPTAAHCVSFSSRFGHSAISSAFNALGGLLALQGSVSPGMPASAPPLASVVTVKRSWQGRHNMLHLTSAPASVHTP